jgi:predicted ABC-type ATPase
VSTVYDAIKAALLVELDTLYPVATYPVDNAEYVAAIDEYVAARYAAAKLSGRTQESYSAVGVSFNFRTAASAESVADRLRVRLARAGFSINAGTPVLHDIRRINERIS